MTDRISEIRARCEAATLGEWKVKIHNEEYGQGYGETTYFVDIEGELLKIGLASNSRLLIKYRSDTDFIANARTDIPYLLDRITALETEKAELLKQIVALAGETVRETEVAREEINRLAAYKDTGLEPEEVARFAQAMRDAVRGAAVGEWTDGPDEDYMICSNCDEPWNVYDNDTHRFKFCPNCGSFNDDGTAT